MGGDERGHAVRQAARAGSSRSRRVEEGPSRSQRRPAFLADPDALKEIAESFAIELYLAETFDLFPASDAFARAESLSVLAALHELEENVLYAALRIPTVEARKAAHEKIMRETAPAFLAFQERFVRGAFYFGDKARPSPLRLVAEADVPRPQPTVADYKLYQMFLRLGDAYGEANPLRVGQYPKLQKIIAALEAGPAGDYARSRRAFG